MVEYIKRSAVFEQFDNADADVCETDDFGGVDYGFGMKNIKELINAIPAADVAPVVHGRWGNGNPICPVCGEDKFKDLDADVVVRCKDCRYRGMIYCPAVHETMGNGLVDYTSDEAYCWRGCPKEYTNAT